MNEATYITVIRVWQLGYYYQSLLNLKVIYSAMVFFNVPTRMYTGYSKTAGPITIVNPEGTYKY